MNSIYNVNINLNSKEIISLDLIEPTGAC